MTARLQQADTLQGVAVGYGAVLIAGLVTEINLVLVVLCALAFVLDLLSGLMKCVALEGLDSIEGDKFMRGLAKKIALTFFWGAAALSDSLLSLMSPGDFGDLVAGLTPILKAVLVATLMHEIASITRNTVKATGSASIGHIILQALRQREMIQPGVEHGTAGHTHVVVIDEGESEDPSPQTGE